MGRTPLWRLEDGAVLPQKAGELTPWRVRSLLPVPPTSSSVTALGSAPRPFLCRPALPCHGGPSCHVGPTLSLVACILLFLLEPDQEQGLWAGHMDQVLRLSRDEASTDGVRGAPASVSSTPRCLSPLSPHRPQDRTGPHS